MTGDKGRPVTSSGGETWGSLGAEESQGDRQNSNDIGAFGRWGKALAGHVRVDFPPQHLPLECSRSGAHRPSQLACLERGARHDFHFSPSQLAPHH